MVKRIFGSLMLVLIATVSILAQIDYNKQIKNGPAVSQGNMNNVRVVDGLKFAQTAAGINAADIDLGSAVGEIWIPSPLITASDAQISISANHTLKIFGRLAIDSVAKGPILLGNSSRIICAGEAAIANISNVGSGTSTSMIRATVQDGSLQGFSVEGCSITAGAQPITNGVIDISGSTTQGWIRNNFIVGFTSGWGIFAQDIQSGALAGTNYVQVMNNQISASNTGGCIEILHSSTNAVTLSHFEIQDINCAAGASIATAPILFQNLSTSSNIAQINLLNVTATGIPVAQNGVQINGVLQFTGKQINCVGSLACVNIANNSSNLGINLDNVLCSGCNNVFNDAANGYTNPNNYINHYGFTASIAGYSGNNILSGVTTSGNFNNIRIVDGIRFPQNATGINAADLDLGTSQGEIWLPTGCCTATDAQILIRPKHTLRILGTLTINAQTQGPILLGNGTGPVRISCSGTSGQDNIVNVGTGIASMIRLSTQDGSQGPAQIDGCRINAGTTTVTNGVIDASGITNGPSWIRDNQIFGFTSGWGIFIQDIQSGSLNGTNNIQMSNNVIAGTGTGGCIELLHSATASVILSIFEILDTNCTGGGSLTTAPVLFQNTSILQQGISRINVMNLQITGQPAGQPGMNVAGIEQGTFRHITCVTGNNCINIANTSNNIAQIFDSIFTFSGNNTLLDSVNSVTLAGPSLLHYEFPNNTNTFSYFPAVSYLRVNGLAPTISVTGCGTGCTGTVEAGSTNNAGVAIISTGTTPGAFGNIQINFNVTQTNFGVNASACAWTLQNGAQTWPNGSTAVINVAGNTSNGIQWLSNGTNLTASTANAYKAAYWCAAK